MPNTSNGYSESTPKTVRSNPDPHMYVWNKVLKEKKLENNCRRSRKEIRAKITATQCKEFDKLWAIEGKHLIWCWENGWTY